MDKTKAPVRGTTAGSDNVGNDGKATTMNEKEGKVFMERSTEMTMKIQQASEVTLPRICENLSKPHSGLQGSFMIIEALMERLEASEDPEVQDMVGKCVVELVTKGNAEIMNFFVDAVIRPGKPNTRLARVKALGRVSGVPATTSEALEAIKERLKTLTESLHDNKEELMDKQVALRDAMDATAAKDQRLNKLRGKVADRVVTDEKRIEDEIATLKANIRAVEDGKLAEEVKKKSEVFAQKLRDAREANSNIKKALMIAMMKDADLLVKEAAIVSLMTIVEPEDESTMMAIEGFLDGRGVVEAPKPGPDATNMVQKAFAERTGAVRARALELLGQCAVRGHSHGISIAIESLGKGGSEGRASLHALKGLAIFGDSTIILNVLKRMEHPDQQVRDLCSSALLLVSEPGDEVAIEGLRNLFSNSSAGVRTSALVAMGSLRVPHDANRRIILALGMCLGMERLHRVRVAALTELGVVARAADPLAVEAAGERVGDKDPTVRLKAIETLAKLVPAGTDHSQVTTMLLRHLEGGEDAVRRSASDALAAVCYGDGGTVFRLAQLVKTHHSPAVRGLAFQALTMCSDPSAFDQTGKMLEGMDEDIEESWKAFKRVSQVAGVGTNGGLAGAPMLVSKTLIPGLRNESAGVRWTTALVLNKVLSSFQPGKSKQGEPEAELKGAAAQAAAKKKAEQAAEDQDENELFRGRSGVEIKRGVFTALIDCFADADPRVRLAAVQCLEVVAPRGGAEQVSVSKGLFSPLYMLILERLKTPSVDANGATMSELQETCVKALLTVEYNAISMEEMKMQEAETQKLSAQADRLARNVPKPTKEQEAKSAELEKRTKVARKAILETIFQMATLTDPAIQRAAIMGVGLLAERGSQHAIEVVTPGLRAFDSLVRLETVEALSRLAKECTCLPLSPNKNLTIVAPPPPCTCGAQAEMVNLSDMLKDGDAAVYQQAARSLDAMVGELRDHAIDDEVLVNLVAACQPHRFRFVKFVPPADAEVGSKATSGAIQKLEPPPTAGSEQDEEGYHGKKKKRTDGVSLEDEWKMMLLSAKRLVFLPLLVKIAERTYTAPQRLMSVSALIRCLFDLNDDVRSLVVQALKQLVDKGHEPSVKLLLDEQNGIWVSENAHVSWMHALAGLAGENDKEVIKVFCDRIGNPPPPGTFVDGVEVKEEVVQESKSSDDDDNDDEEDTLGAVEVSVDLWVVRRTAADCLGECAIRGNSYAIGLLQPHLSNRTSSVRNAALRAMGHLSIQQSDKLTRAARPGARIGALSTGLPGSPTSAVRGAQTPGVLKGQDHSKAKSAVDVSVIASNIRSLAHGLGNTGEDIEVYELLTSAANAPQAVTRRASLDTLSVMCKNWGRTKPQLVDAAVETAILCLSDYDVSVRQRAVKLLGMTTKGDEDIIERLINIAMDSEGELGWQSSAEGRQFAVKALTAIVEKGDEEVCDCLVTLIEDSERLVRQASADALTILTATDDIDTLAMLQDIRDRPDKDWVQRGELIKEIKASVTGVLQKLAVHWVPAEVRHGGVDALMVYMKKAYEEELQCRQQDELEEGVELEISLGSARQNKAVHSIKDGRFDDARREVKQALEYFEKAYDLHLAAEEGVSQSDTLMKEHRELKGQIEEMIGQLDDLMPDIEARRGGVNRREFIDRKIRAEALQSEDDPNPYDLEGWSRLHYASQWGLVDRINNLIQQGAKVNCTVAKGPYVGRTPHDLAKDEQTKHCLHAHGGVPCFQLKYLIKREDDGLARLASANAVKDDEESRAKEVQDAIEQASAESVKRASNNDLGKVKEREDVETAKAGHDDRPASAKSLRLPKKELQTAEVSHKFLEETGGLKDGKRK